MKLYTEEEIQKHNEIFVREDKFFGMTFRFYVFENFEGEYTNLALYKYDFGSKTYEEINVYFIDVLDDEKLDKEIKKDLREYMMRPLIQKYISRYITLNQHNIKIRG